MRPKLILIEGLPGFGKTTTAQLVQEILAEINIKSQLFLEGNLDHPADYEGVAYFKQNEFDELLRTHEVSRDLLSNHAIKQGNDFLLEYQKIKSEYGSGFPDDLLRAVVKNDVYELPLNQHRRLIADRWKRFTANALNGPDTFVFECCFIQNPVTMAMIKCGAEEIVLSYVMELATIVERLNPLLIYVEQSDLDGSFRKAVKDRPKEWSESFINYYTNQGYGKERGYSGLEGTLQVLKARKKLEEEIFVGMKIAKKKVDNSSYDINDYKQVLLGILSEYFISTN
ncbi:hypothetical protein ACFPVX_18475 [Cohnella faecalis]|uniref:Group-specific protein n=1 Tax=Cohnella faecalis TaxID=2315694 RepID=A0A398CF58_9BACL|nr:hypothetical protein [Cohnella faecalis]RIE01210.1 hypothetical protein D3H35_22705 [Cohnella faecalis]